MMTPMRKKKKKKKKKKTMPEYFPWKKMADGGAIDPRECEVC